MKGVVFTEFLKMIEGRYGLPMVELIIEGAKLPNNGAYTSVGSYDHTELLRLVRVLSKLIETPQPDLLKAFGRHLFGTFVLTHPRLFQGTSSAIAFLQGLEHYIHVEVRKLYPDAELPSFTYETVTPHRLVMVYQSQCPFADLAEGIIQGCIAHYREDISLRRKDLESGAMTRVRFTLTKES